MVKGFPSWNVPLSRTLNKLPPGVHESEVKITEKKKPETISGVKTVDESSFLLSVASDGSVNVWNSAVTL